MFEEFFGGGSSATKEDFIKLAKRVTDLERRLATLTDKHNKNIVKIVEEIKKINLPQKPNLR